MTAALHHKPAPPAPRPPETDAERRVRHLETLREMAELAMTVARHAAALSIAQSVAQSGAQSGAPAKPQSPDPSLTFARAARAARQAIALEARIAVGDLAQPRPPRPAPGFAPAGAADPAAPPDPRRALLRQALHQAVKAEPDRAARTALTREIDERIERELADDPEAEIPCGEILAKLAAQLNLPIDPSRLSDAVLGVLPAEPSTRGADPPWPGRYHQRE